MFQSVPLSIQSKVGQRHEADVSTLSPLEKYYPREKAPAPDFDRLTDFFLGKKLPLPEVDRPEVAQPKIERYIVEKVVGHKPGPGRKSHLNYKYRLRLKGYGPSADLEYRADEVPQCQHLIDEYRSEHQLNPAPSPHPQARNLRKRKRVSESVSPKTKLPKKRKPPETCTAGKTPVTCRHARYRKRDRR